MIRGAKACPFCGNLESLCWFSTDSEESELDILLETCHDATICCSILDGGCGATSGYAHTEEKILSLWNTRASPIWIKMKE